MNDLTLAELEGIEEKLRLRRAGDLHQTTWDVTLAKNADALLRMARFGVALEAECRKQSAICARSGPHEVYFGEINRILATLPKRTNEGEAT